MRNVRAALMVAAMLAAPMAAHATMFDGYLADCSAITATSCTELSSAGYARQPISFGDAVKGVSRNTVPYSFGSTGSGSIVGRALFDAPTGGNLVAVIPLATAITAPPVDQADSGTITLNVAALAAYQVGRSYSGTIAAGATIGTSGDGSTVTAGIKDAIRQGYLTAALPNFDASYLGPVTQTTGFAITSLTIQAHYVVHGAGTLATGAVQLPSNPTDGQTFTLACDVTVTGLTISVASGFTLSGAPTSCGPTAGREWFYVGGAAKTWYELI
jgi:hypothetical protein